MTRLKLLALFLALPGLAFAQMNVVPTEPEVPPPPQLVTVPAADPVAPPPQATQPPPSTPADPATYRSLVKGHKLSPAWTQDRAFSSTRLWLLDPGSYTIETWFHGREYPTWNGTKAPAEMKLQQELEYGLFPHVQLDLYLNFNFNQQDGSVLANNQPDTGRHLAWEAAQIEFRIAIPNYYGQIPLNPVIYLEYQAWQNAPGRIEARLLLGGQVLPWLFLAANPYIELNVGSQMVDSGTKDAMQNPILVSRYLEDAEAGTTLAAGFRINERFRLSAEAKMGVDMLGDVNNKFHFVAWAGPGFILRPMGNNLLKITGTMLFNLGGTDHEPTHGAPQMYEPWLIVGSTF